jgi:hypothetical protein
VYVVATSPLTDCSKQDLVQASPSIDYDVYTISPFSPHDGIYELMSNGSIYYYNWNKPKDWSFQLVPSWTTIFVPFGN